MTTYIAPMRDMTFVINELADLQGVVTLPAYQEMTPDLVAAVLEQAAKFANEVLAPLNKLGDERGASWSKAGVPAAEGFGGAYRQFIDNGWSSLSGDPEYGGQGLPGWWLPRPRKCGTQRTCPSRCAPCSPPARWRRSRRTPPPR